MKEYSYQAKHMGTNVSLSFVCEDQATGDQMAKSAFTTIQDYEKRFSRFLPESELSILNQQGTSKVSDEFIALILRSLELTELTAGNFNPLLQVATLGYTQTYPSLSTQPTSHLKTNSSYDTNYKLCQIDTTTKSIALGPNQQLDFGGILKGYLAEILADKLMAANSTCTGCIINIGGDITTRGMDEFHNPFIFYLYNPVTGNEIPVTIQDASLATSGTYARKWQTSNGIMNHIVDNRTQQNPTETIVAVSIIAQNGAMTEAITKLFLTRGLSEATEIIPPDIYHYKYFIVTQNGDVTSTII